MAVVKGLRRGHPAVPRLVGLRSRKGSGFVEYQGTMADPIFSQGEGYGGHQLVRPVRQRRIQCERMAARTRVAVVARGATGLAISEALIAREDCELVGALDVRPELPSTRLGSLVAGPPAVPLPSRPPRLRARQQGRPRDLSIRRARAIL
jgi:hypothetical protein